MPPQLRERVGKWTHEPVSNFIHKKHLSDAFTHSFIFSTILFRKYKTYLLSCSHNQNPKTPLPHHIYFIALLFTLLHLLSYFIYIHLHLVLDNHSVELGHKTRRLFCRLLEEERGELFWLFPESLILNPEFPRGEYILLLQHSALGVPMSWHLFLVSSECFLSLVR
jgi:hypothetical protein